MEITEKLWLIGTNRRCDKPIVELQLLFNPLEQTALEQAGGSLPHTLSSLLSDIGVDDSRGLLDYQYDAVDHQLAFCQLFTKLVLVLQNAAGHRVHESGVVADHAGRGYWIWIEYEHDAVAAAAISLASCLLGSLEPRLQLAAFQEDALELENISWEDFLAVARPRVLPLEAQAIIDAAQASNIPCVKLERMPYQQVEGRFRIRPNGLLKLGHGPYQQIVDGSICVSRDASLMPLLADRKARRTLLSNQGLPVPTIDPQAGNCALSKHALRAADQIGYPVTLTVKAANGQQFSWPDITDPVELRSRLDQARKHGMQIDLEASVAGENWHVLMVGEQLLVLLSQGQVHPAASLHPETLQQLKSLAAHLNSSILRIDLCTGDIGMPLGSANGAALDFDLAPRLDDWLGEYPTLLAGVAEAFVGHLFPSGSQARVPIVTVTGTNGKTTTCRMTEAILRKSGLGTGMVCTGTNYVNGRLEEVGRSAWHGRQLRMFDKPEVDVVVLEEFLGTILGTGFLYQQSDVAVCTNVTNDHLGSVGIHDLDALIAAKAMVIKRASKAAVLNADNGPSINMMAATSAENIGLVSLQQSADTLLGLLDRPGMVCTREIHDGEYWLVFHQDDQHWPVVRENEIAATYEGKAAHNTANAMQAALAAHFLGIERDHIRCGLAGFLPDMTCSEGRLNMMPGLPFQFLLDYAHNLDGFRVLYEFTDQLEIVGERILLLCFYGNRKNIAVQQAIKSIAMHFDIFYCTNSVALRGREFDEMPQLLAKYLVESGVSPDNIKVDPDRLRAMEASINKAKTGDLLVILSDPEEFRFVWNKVERLKKD